MISKFVTHMLLRQTAAVIDAMSLNILIAVYMMAYAADKHRHSSYDSNLLDSNVRCIQIPVDHYYGIVNNRDTTVQLFQLLSTK